MPLKLRTMVMKTWCQQARRCVYRRHGAYQWLTIEVYNYLYVSCQSTLDLSLVGAVALHCPSRDFPGPSVANWDGMR